MVNVELTVKFSFRASTVLLMVQVMHYVLYLAPYTHNLV